MYNDLHTFLKDIGPKENGHIAEIKQLAKEWALGVHQNLWPSGFSRFTSSVARPGKVPIDENFTLYLDSRWPGVDFDHLVDRLAGHGYANGNRLSQAAFQLLYEAAPYNIFISYKRSESSALALLCVCRLKAEDLVPFVDMALEAGGNWHADLEKRIKENDYFIILLGKETLASEMSVKEICWAKDSKSTIIPIWHNGFGQQSDFKLDKHIDDMAVNWEDSRLRERKDEIRDVIQQTHAIIVQDESASGYNTAIVELLNRFGITP